VSGDYASLSSALATLQTSANGLSSALSTDFASLSSAVTGVQNSVNKIQNADQLTTNNPSSTGYITTATSGTYLYGPSGVISCTFPLSSGPCSNAEITLTVVSSSTGAYVVEFIGNSGASNQARLIVPITNCVPTVSGGISTFSCSQTITMTAWAVQAFTGSSGTVYYAITVEAAP
jgi:hypothetical protein